MPFIQKGFIIIVWSLSVSQFQHAAVASTSLPLRTFSARAVRHTASMTVRAHGTATAWMATIELSPTLRPWLVQVSPSCHWQINGAQNT